MNYKATQETLNRLDELLTEIKIKERDVKFSIDFNKKFGMIDTLIPEIKQLQDELKELEFEFQNLKRKL